MHAGLVIAREQTQWTLDDLHREGPAELRDASKPYVNLLSRLDDGVVTPQDARRVKWLAEMAGTLSMHPDADPAKQAQWSRTAFHAKALGEAVEFQVRMQGPLRTALGKANDWFLDHGFERGVKVPAGAVSAD